ncbi:MAG: hypothetical protein ACKVPX_04525 [Myxococcaceae bacterium]
MSIARLEQIGLAARETATGVEAELELTSTSAINPMSQTFIDSVRLLLVDDTLVPIFPPEMAGLVAIPLASVASRAQLEDTIVEAFNHHIAYLQRRSAELQALGLSPQVDPSSLELSAEVQSAPHAFVIAADKQGHFRVLSATRDGKELETTHAPVFELSEFREVGALAGYLTALYDSPPPSPAQPITEPLIGFDEIAACIGTGARVPPRSAIEVLVEMRVAGVPYRFAAARLAGRSFRGLLAGPTGKLWAERFDLDTFPGATVLLGSALGVEPESIEVVSPQGS